MNKIISQLEFWLILFAIAAVPNWSWPIFGDASESRMIVLGLGVLVFAVLEVIKVIMPGRDPALREGRGLYNFGFLKNPLNWIISTPLLLGLIGLILSVISGRDAACCVSTEAGIQFFGFGMEWSVAVWPILLLLAWHFLLRGFFSVVIASEAKQSDSRTERVSQIASVAPEGLPRNDKSSLLKFAFVWLIVFAVIALTRGLLHSSPNPLLGEERDITNIGLWFIIASILALSLSALRVPLSGPAKSYRLGRFIYPLIIILIIIFAFFVRLEINFAAAARAASKGDFNLAHQLNPYYPLYTLSWVEQEIANLENTDLTADVSASKQKVGDIVKELEGLSSSQMTIRIARAWEQLGKFVEGGYDRAISIYDSLISSAGENPDPSLIIKKALLLEKSGKTNEAIVWLKPWFKSEKVPGVPAAQRAGNIGSGTLEILYHLGRMLYNTGKEKEAVDIWLSIIKEDPNYADVNYSLGLYFVKEKKNGQALEYFNKVLKLNPGNESVKKKIDELNGKR